MADFRMQWENGNLEGERILKLTGAFTLSTVFDFQDAIRKDPPRITIIDMSDVLYMDSAALGSLLGLHVSCQRDQRRYGLIGASDRIQTLFRVAGVNTILTIYGSLQEAENSLGARVASA